MQKRPPSDLSDYWEIVLRRRWWILLTPLLVSGVTRGVIRKLPKIYRSETLILVEPQKVPLDYVKPVVSTDVNDRLQTIRQEIRSRSRLQRIIDQFGLYRDRRDLTQEDIIGLMRKDITIEAVQDEQLRDHPWGVFKIDYEGRDPALVQQVTRQIASLFIEENRKVREQQAEGTNEFIEAELEKARQDLATQDKRLADFKARHLGALPDQQAANLQVLGQLQLSLQENTDALARAQERKTQLLSLLSASAKHEAAFPKAPLEAELATRRAELAVSERTYTPNHPDVIRLRQEIKALEAQQAERLKKAGGTTLLAASSDSLDQIQSGVPAAEDEIKLRTLRQADFQKQIKVIQARVEMLPAVEQQLAELTRDYEISKANYESLLQKKNASAMASEMERRAKGEQFRILDPASYPERPYKPNVAQFTLLGSLVGVLGGFALGLLMEYRDNNIYSDKDIGFYLSMPVLASVPVITTKQSLLDARRRRRIAVGVTSFLVIAALMAMAFFYFRAPLTAAVKGWF